MAGILFIDNHMDFVIDPITLRAGGPPIEDAVFSVTLYDPDGNPVSGATALNTAFEEETSSNVALIPGTITVTAGPGYTIDASGTGAYLNAINIRDYPVVVQERSQ